MYWYINVICRVNSSIMVSEHFSQILVQFNSIICYLLQPFFKSSDAKLNQNVDIIVSRQ